MSNASLLFVGDSRSYGFFRYEQPKNFETLFCVKRGAKIDDLIGESLEKLKEVRTDLPLIVKIAAGINNLTKFTRHQGGKELIASDISIAEVCNKLDSLKSKIKEARSDALVGFVTIPTLSFENWRWTGKNLRR